MATRKRTTAAPKPRKNALGGELKPVKRSRKTTKAKPSQPTEKKEQTSSPRPGLSLLEAAHQILQQASQPMTCRQLVEAAANQGLWSSPAGKTPHNTLYTSILREINTQGDASRFVKIDRGQFATSGK